MTKIERSRTDLALLNKRLGKQFDDWPEALTLRQIGLLISQTYWKRADPGHGLYERIAAAVKCGELLTDGPPIVELQEIADNQPPYQMFFVGGLPPREWGSPEWNGEFNRRPSGNSGITRRLIQTNKEETVQISTIRPEAVAMVLQGKELPELLAAWIAAVRNTPNPKEDSSMAPEESDGKIRQSKAALALVVGLLAIDLAERYGHKNRGNPNGTKIAEEVEALIETLTNKGFSRPQHFNDRTVADAIAAGLASIKRCFREGAKVFDD